MQLSETKPPVCSYHICDTHTHDRNVFHAWKLFCVNCQIVCFRHHVNLPFSRMVIFF